MNSIKNMAIKTKEDIMEIIGNSLYEDEKNKRKKTTRIIIILIVILMLMVVGIIVAVIYMQSLQFKTYIDGKNTSLPEDTFIIDNANNKVYVSIKDIAKYLGYEVHNGEYKVLSEDTNKCYVESANETASFYLNSNKINKVAPDTNEDYESYTISEPVKMVKDKLYVLSEGIEKGFNVQFTYDAEKNNVQIFTLSYLVQYYNPQVVKYGFDGISEEFSNQKAILYDMFVVNKTTDKNVRCGVIDPTGKEIIATRYDEIDFKESTQEFFVSTNKKVGILLSNGSIKIGISYDEIKLIDKELGLYLVKNNNKYGVLDEQANYVIHMECDAIGVDTTQYPSNNIENQYILFGNAIPIRQGQKWGLYNKSGQLILPIEYDSIGCTTSNSQKKATNSLLIIPEYEAIIVCKDRVYGIVDSTGKQLVPCLLTTIYSTTTGGVDEYFMEYNEQVYNIKEYFEQNKIATPKTTNNSSNIVNQTNTTNETIQ